MSELLLINGVGRAIGGEIALAAARNGWNICANFLRRNDEAERIVDECREHGVEAIAVQADLSDEKQVVRLFRTAEQEIGDITGLVNACAVAREVVRTEDITQSQLTRCFTMNVNSYFLCCREAVKRMSRKRGGDGGKIVNLFGNAGLAYGADTMIHHNAAMAALESMTKGLAREVADDGILVNGVRYGLIEDIWPEDVAEILDPDAREEHVPMGRMGRADEVADAVAWLMSGTATYVSGSILDVSGADV